ncbi:MAG: hypothetical protein IT274_07765 [Chitinophagales bacterium]|nr:hypothetical protein [Chitinophagales bacterium]
MNISIQPDRLLVDIQKDFQALFPFLKVEFYKDTHLSGEGTAGKERLDPHVAVGELSAHTLSFSWHVSPESTVSELESSFQEKTGIGLQIFRKSGNNWLQTTTTDYKTLAEQNARGEEMSHKTDLTEEPEDYHEQE